jgi:hypothetical protein
MTRRPAASLPLSGDSPLLGLIPKQGQRNEIIAPLGTTNVG